MGLVPGLVKGLGVTFKEITKTVVKGPETVQYPHQKEDPAPRARGVIALHEEQLHVVHAVRSRVP